MRKLCVEIIINYRCIACRSEEHDFAAREANGNEMGMSIINFKVLRVAMGEDE